MKERKKSKTSIIDGYLEKGNMTSKEIIDGVIKEMKLDDSKETRKKIRRMFYVRVHNRKKKGDKIGYLKHPTTTIKNKKEKEGVEEVKDFTSNDQNQSGPSSI